MFCDCCGVCFDDVTGRNIVDHNKFVVVCNPCKDALEEDEGFVVFLNKVECMVAGMKEVAKESSAISISFTSICGVEIHVTNNMFARIQGSECEIDTFLSGDYPFRAKKSFGGAIWFTLIKGEKVRPFVEDCFTVAERHRAVGTYLDSLRTKK